MDGIDLLRQQALTRRNAQIKAAKREYHAALLDINAIARKLRLKQTGRPCKNRAADYSGLRATTVAKEILREGKAWSLVELTIEVQCRGCRALDDPRAVAHAIRCGLLRYKEEFRRDERGRWDVGFAQKLQSIHERWRQQRTVASPFSGLTRI